MSKKNQRKTNKRTCVKTHKNKKTSTLRKRGGCYSCSKQNGGFGEASYQPINSRHFYSAENQGLSPLNPSNITEGRNFSTMIKGGRRKRIRGGRLSDIIVGQGNNPYLTTGNSSGIFSNAALAHSDPITNINVSSNPVMNSVSSKYA